MVELFVYYLVGEFWELVCDVVEYWKYVDVE